MQPASERASRSDFLFALSRLLDYPDEALRDSMPHLRRAIKNAVTDSGIPSDLGGDLLALADRFAKDDLLDLQERWVQRFDTGRWTSLHLFEHVHGESRDRGQALVDLRDRYAQNGLVLSESELPDYLPALLEYLGTQSDEEVAELAADFARLFGLLEKRLRDEGSEWAPVLRALIVLLELEGSEGIVQVEARQNAGLGGLVGADLPASGPENGPESIDEAYKEPPAMGPDPRMLRRIAMVELNGGTAPLRAPEGLVRDHPLRRQFTEQRPAGTKKASDTSLVEAADNRPEGKEKD